MELKMIKKNSNGPIYGYLNDSLIDLEDKQIQSKLFEIFFAS